MSKLTIRYSNNGKIKPVLTVDGKELKGTKKGRDTVFEYETTASAARIRVYNVLEASSPLYFLTTVLYFILSVFGIFDDYSDYKCRKISFDASVSTLTDSEIKLTARGFSNSEKVEAIKTECSTSADVYENKFYVDKAALKRTKIATAMRVVLFVASLSLIIYLVVSG